MDKSTGKFIITNNEGQEIEYEVLFTFDNNETKKSYIIFTDNTLDENDNIKVFANTYDPEGKSLDLGPIETDKEWQLIEGILSQLQTKVGESSEQEGN